MKNNFDKALMNYFKSLEIRKELLGEKHLHVADSYMNIGIIYNAKSEYDKALEYHFKALAIKKEILSDKHLDVSNSYNNIGIVYLKKTEYDKALEYFFKSLAIRKDLLGEKHSNVAVSYNNIGMVFKIKNEYDKALEYYLKSLAIRKELLGEKHTDVAISYNNIGNVYRIKAEYIKALECQLKCLKIYKELFGEIHIEVANAYNNIGNIYFSKLDKDKALEYYLKSLDIRKQLLGENHTDIADSYLNIGSVRFEKHEFDKALEVFFKSLAIYKKLNGEKHTDVAVAYNNIGQIFLKKNEFSKALEYYQKGMASCLRNFNDTVDVSIVPIIANYLEWSELLKAIQAKAQIFAATNRLELALLHYQSCDTLIDLIRKEITTHSDKLTLGAISGKIYNEAVQLSVKLKVESGKLEDKKYFSELSFYFSEKNKSSVLLQALTGREAQKNAGIPEELLKREHQLKIDIAHYSKQLADLEELDSLHLILYQNALFAANRSYDSLIYSFEKQFPEYYALKYNHKVITVAELQSKTLKDGKTAMISYTVSDSTITIFTITNQTFEVQQVARPKNLLETIEYFRGILIKSNAETSSDYQKTAFTIYRLLFPKKIDKKIENLIIIPDNLLASIPFEALVIKKKSDKAKFQELPYLIYNYNISYSYSATLFNRTNSKQESQSAKDWIAFAPVFDDINTTSKTLETKQFLTQLRKINDENNLARGRVITSGDSIPPLPCTESEVRGIFAQFEKLKYNAKVELRNNATELLIKSEELMDYKIIHFATHGFVNSEIPELSGILLAQDSIGGNDGILYSGEIFNLKINADLVVLSACESGLGKINEGEGIIGLTRAFLYAGAKNSMVSLWQVSDKSTSDLMIDFYINYLKSFSLKKSQDFNNCLRQAKLKMIKNGKFVHPFYWSAFILIGK